MKFDPLNNMKHRMISWLLAAIVGGMIAITIIQVSCWDMDTNHGATQALISYELDNLRIVWHTLHRIW